MAHSLHRKQRCQTALHELGLADRVVHLPVHEKEPEFGSVMPECDPQERGAILRQDFCTQIFEQALRLSHLEL